MGHKGLICPFQLAGMSSASVYWAIVPQDPFCDWMVSKDREQHSRVPVAYQLSVLACLMAINSHDYATRVL